MNPLVVGRSPRDMVTVCRRAGLAPLLLAAIATAAGVDQFALEAEINATSSLISLYQRRLSVLRHLQAEEAAGKKCVSKTQVKRSPPAPSLLRLRVSPSLIAALANSSVELPLAPLCGGCTGPALGVEHRELSREREAASFQKWFVPRGTLKRSGASCMDVLAVKQRVFSRSSHRDGSAPREGSTSFLTAVASPDGLLTIHDVDGSLLHTQPLPTKKTTSDGSALDPCVPTHVKFGPSSSRPFIMLTTKDGRLLVYHISLWRLGHLVLGDRRAAHRAVAEAAMNVTIARRAGGDSTFGRNASLSVSGAEDFLDAGGGGSGVAVLTNLTANVDIGQSLALYKARMQVAVVGADGSTLPVAEETSTTSRPVPATSIALYTSGGVQHVITGTVDGHLCIWNADAQLLDVHAPRPSALARLSATSEPGPLVPQYAVTALAKGSSTIAYAMTNVIGFFALSRGSFQPFVCRAVRASA